MLPSTLLSPETQHQARWLTGRTAGSRLLPVLLLTSLASLWLLLAGPIEVPSQAIITQKPSLIVLMANGLRELPSARKISRHMQRANSVDLLAPTKQDFGTQTPATSSSLLPSHGGLLTLCTALGGVVFALLARQKSHDPQWLMCNLSGDDEEAQAARRSLVEEIENPYRKIRYFFYLAIGGASGLSALVELPRLAAALNGINSDNLTSSVTNLGVSAVVSALMVFFFQRDKKDELKRLERIKVGSAISALKVQFTDTNERLKLADLRRGRGRATRVVLVAAPPNLIRECLETARSVADRLVAADLLVVPITLPIGWDAGLERELLSGEHVAVPAGGDWAGVVDTEVQRAQEQGVDAMKQGFTLVIKKNGRVGQRILGLPPLARLAGDVEERKATGMDVENI